MVKRKYSYPRWKIYCETPIRRVPKEDKRGDIKEKTRYLDLLIQKRYQPKILLELKEVEIYGLKKRTKRNLEHLAKRLNVKKAYIIITQRKPIKKPCRWKIKVYNKKLSALWVFPFKTEAEYRKWKDEYRRRKRKWK